ncbi:MAG: UDP-glucuronic acid decarboxylase family protein [Chloroflexota bacterium]
MRVVITGGAGFIGSHLSESYLNDGHHVVAVDNLLTGSEDNIQHLIDHPNFEYVRHDVIDGIDIAGDVDGILHFASPASPPHYLKMPVETLRVGAEATYHCLNMAVKKNARFLMASTSEIYGDPLEHPQAETYHGNVSTIGPRGVYDEAKRYAESMTMAYHRSLGVETRIVRIFNTYGPRMNMDDGRVVPNFIVQALRGEPLTVYGDGMQTRSFQYVDDLVRGVRRLLECNYAGPVNIGNPVEITIKQFAEIVNEVTGNEAGIIMKPTDRIEDDPQRRQPDISLAKRELDWEPIVDLREGLAKTMIYFKELI